MSKERKIEILDCTLRDGGMGLEDAVINGISTLEYSKEKIYNLIELLEKSNIDIIELGAIELSKQDKSGFSIYQSIDEGSALIKKDYVNQQKYTLLFRGPDTPLEDIPEWNVNRCQYLRVIIRYSEIKKSLEFCEGLSKKGYKVFVQPMVTSRYSDDELDLLINYTNKMGAHALYIVDSYGHMNKDELGRLFNFYDRRLDNNISIGFHGHNNMNLAFSNTLELLDFPSNRNLIIDSTLVGMGQGAGNLQTELASYFLRDNYSKNYKIKYILEGIELIEDFMHPNLWGYSVLNLMPAVYKTAYKYASVLRNKYGLRYSEIDRVLELMPEDYRHRYTLENIEELLKL